MPKHVKPYDNNNFNSEKQLTHFLEYITNMSAKKSMNYTITFRLQNIQYLYKNRKACNHTATIYTSPVFPTNTIHPLNRHSDLQVAHECSENSTHLVFGSGDFCVGYFHCTVIDAYYGIQVIDITRRLL